MMVRVGIENNNDNRSIAWALEHPGCFAYGRDAEEACANMTQAVQDYAAWIRQHGMSWMDGEPVEIRIEETFDAYVVHQELDGVGDSAQDYMIESFFRYDAEPLGGTDIERAFKLLDWSRQDLLGAVQGLSAQQLNEKRPGERWSINGILNHVAHAEWWYQERLDMRFPDREDDLPADPLEALEIVRSHFTSVLPRQAGVHHMLDVEAETWSPRKMLRRAAWHERDHTQHIRKLL
jgi:DinB superfamily